jgi:hypothetical protein
MNAAEASAAAVTFLAPLGGAIAFVWSKVEARFAAIEAKLEACQEREDASLKGRGVLIAVTELLWQEVKRIAPRSPTLTRSRRLLDEIHELTGLD